MGKWEKVYFSKEQYDEFKNGQSAIGFTELDIFRMKELEKNGFDCFLTDSPLNYMTKLDPTRIKEINWSTFGVMVR